MPSLALIECIEVSLDKHFSDESDNQNITSCSNVKVKALDVTDIFEWRSDDVYPHCDNYICWNSTLTHIFRQHAKGIERRNVFFWHIIRSCYYNFEINVNTNRNQLFRQHSEFQQTIKQHGNRHICKIDNSFCTSVKHFVIVLACLPRQTYWKRASCLNPLKCGFNNVVVHMLLLFSSSYFQ